jgi:hypothetical protein
MNEARWLACNDPRLMLEVLSRHGNAAERTLRLFACACLRRAWHLLSDAQARRVVKMTEIFADGLCGGSKWSRERWRGGAWQELVGGAVGAVLDWQAAAAARNVSRLTAEALGTFRELPAQAAILRDLGRPGIRPRLAVDSSWLAANGGAVAMLARSMYEERGFDSAPILADALEDAACTDNEVLEHLRGPGPHVRGCWAIDWLLAKGVRPS